MTERLQDLQEGKTSVYFNHYFAAQVESFYQKLEKWRELQDPGEEKEIINNNFPFDKETLDEDMFISLRRDLGC